MEKQYQYLDGISDTNTDITPPKRTNEERVSKCPICGCEYLMEHRYDDSYKICMKCGHNWKE